MNKFKNESLERLVTSVVAGLVAMALTGCPSPPPAADEHAGHEHADHAAPTTLAEAHEQLEHMAADIKAAFDAGQPSDAHDALHEIGLVINELPELAKKAGVTAADEAKQVSDDLMDGFGKLDNVLHGGDAIAWPNVSDKIDAAMAKIEGWLPEGADHDHEGHNHEGHEHEDDEHAHE